MKRLAAAATVLALLVFGVTFLAVPSSASHVQVVLEDFEDGWGTLQISGSTGTVTPTWSAGVTDRLFVVETLSRTAAVSSATLNGVAMARWSAVTASLGGNAVRLELWVFTQTIADGALTLSVTGDSDADAASGQISWWTFSGVNTGRPIGEPTTDLQTSTPATYPNCLGGVSPGVCRDTSLATDSGTGTLWTAVLEGASAPSVLGGNDADATSISSPDQGTIFGGATYFEDGDTDENAFTWIHGDGSAPNSGSDSLYVNRVVNPAGHSAGGGGGGGGGPAIPTDLSLACPLSPLDWLVLNPVDGHRDVTIYDGRPEAALAVLYIVGWGDGVTTLSATTPVNHTYPADDVYTLSVRVQHRTGLIEIFTTQVDTRGNNCSAQKFANEYLGILLMLAVLFILAAVITIASRRIKGVRKKMFRRLFLWLGIGIILFALGFVIYAALAGIPI